MSAEPNLRPVAPLPRDAAPLVALAGVTKSYASGGAEQRVLDRVSLTLAKRDLMVVLGPSGSGKTTLLNLVGGLDHPDEGRVTSCGVELGGASRKELAAYRARCVGFVFQFYNLVPTLTALENVEAGLTVAGMSTREARRRGEEMLRRVGLGAHLDRFPRQLSGGEQQRVAIARAFGKRPPLVLADEPTGNLDDESAATVVGLLRELIDEEGSTALIVTHNEALAGAGTKVARLHGHHVESS